MPPNAEPGFWYLASPYTSRDARVREERFRWAAYAAAVLNQSGLPVYSPIAEGHAISKVVPDISTTWEAWAEHDKAMIRAAEGVIILKLDGWIQSKGVAAEADYAESLGLPVRLMGKAEIDEIRRQQAA